jgi:hypothetical protein
MTNQHPITPPPELVQQWTTKYVKTACSFTDIANEVSQWGADRGLESCVEWLILDGYVEAANKLHAILQPKPPSLKEQALTALHAVATGANDTREQHQDLDTIRKALEKLPND